MRKPTPKHKQPRKGLITKRLEAFKRWANRHKLAEKGIGGQFLTLISSQSFSDRGLYDTIWHRAFWTELLQKTHSFDWTTEKLKTDAMTLPLRSIPLAG